MPSLPQQSRQAPEHKDWQRTEHSPSTTQDGFLRSVNSSLGQAVLFAQRAFAASDGLSDRSFFPLGTTVVLATNDLRRKTAASPNASY